MGREQRTWRLLRLTGRAMARCQHCGVTHEYQTQRSRQGLCQPVVYPPGYMSGAAQGVEVEVFAVGPLSLVDPEEDATAYDLVALRVAEGAIRCERCGERFTNLDRYADHPCQIHYR